MTKKSEEQLEIEDMSGVEEAGAFVIQNVKQVTFIVSDEGKAEIDDGNKVSFWRGVRVSMATPDGELPAGKIREMLAGISREVDAALLARQDEIEGRIETKEEGDDFEVHPDFVDEGDESEWQEY